MDNLLIVLILAAAATTTMSILSIIFLYSNSTNSNFLRFFSSSATSSLIRSKHNRIQLPLGTFGLPFLGETIEFVTCAYSDSPESFMNKRCHLYGKVFKSHIFGSPTIVSTDAEVSKIVLQSDAKSFVPSYPKSLTELMGKSSILLINGALQRRIHGLIGAFFKSPHLKAQITTGMQNYVQQSMEKWRDDHFIYIQDETKHIAFQVLVKALISLDPGEDMEFLKKQFQEFIAGLMSIPINIPGSRLYRSLQAKKKMVKLVQKIIQARKKESDIISNKVPKDVVDVLLSDTSEQLTDNLIADNMIDMMIPGEDSVPLLMTIAVKYLSDSPTALQQLAEENTKLKTQKDELGEPLCWSDYLSLPFTQNVITETLRMGNIITGVMRKAMKDVEIKGYLIPKGWCVFTYFRSVHLDQNNYDWPYHFNPWRWQDKDMSSCNFTPFGGGQRLCPGLDLARLEASIFLHHFVTQFSWAADDDTIVSFPTVRMKRRMPIRVKRKVGSYETFHALKDCLIAALLAVLFKILWLISFRRCDFVIVILQRLRAMVFFKCFKSNTITILVKEGNSQDRGTTLKLCVPLTGPKVLVLPTKDNSIHIKSCSSEVSWEVADFGPPNMKKKVCTSRILILNPSHHVRDNPPASFELLDDRFHSRAVTWNNTLSTTGEVVFEVAQRLVECFRKTVGQSMIHGRLVLLELIFLVELIHESVGELFFVVGDDVARHTISVDDMLLDEMDNSFLLDFP
ncbi:3-epi-6-deoxocathasterone 23-monooxygenase CYP90D1-like [Pyrus communis]|uniref:3-epi-6-deoxocathasterone 23-monooxygenase CYP90D1-like n=1 Tax=Pyrus communis TaxID=23211 RepID=UPI0035C0ECB3